MLVTSQALATTPTRDDRIALRGSGGALSYTELRAHAAAVGEHPSFLNAHTHLVRLELNRFQKLYGIGRHHG